MNFIYSLHNDYSVTLKIMEDQESTLVSQTGTFSSELLQRKNGSFYGFEILFDSSVKTKKNTKHQILALISGPISSCGHDNLSTIECSGVTFTFTSNPNLGNKTGTLSGQFPEILFSVLA